MRSEKNPWFLLRNSKNPDIQAWLKKAETMSKEEILALQIKKDVQRAMLYVQQQKDNVASQGVAESLADLMQANHKSQTESVYPIYRYNDTSTFFTTERNTQVNIECGDPWILDNNRAYVNSSWGFLIANPWLIRSSASICNGTFSDLARMKQEAIQKRHPLLQNSDNFSIIRYA
jgi:hypothetical protein